MSRPRQYKAAAALKRDPRVWEVEPVEYWFELDESQPWLMPEAKEPQEKEPCQPSN